MGAHASVILGDYLYLFGGTFFNAAYNASLRYHLPSGTWEELTRMPENSEHLTAAAVGNKIYVVGGRRRVGFQLTNSNILLIYSPQTNTWEEGPDMTTARSGLASVAFGDAFLTFGGEGFDDGGYVFPQVERYTPATETWDSLTRMPLPVHGIGAALLDGKIYIVGGGVTAGWSTTAAAAVFSPPQAQATAVEAIPNSVKPGMSVYPNPVAAGFVTVDLDGGIGPTVQVVVFDMLGREIKRTSARERIPGGLRLSTLDLAPGRYLIRASNGEAILTSVFVKTGN
jgi:hypothetical protein